jgi:hypothetical protein
MHSDLQMAAGIKGAAGESLLGLEARSQTAISVRAIPNKIGFAPWVAGSLTTLAAGVSAVSSTMRVSRKTAVISPLGADHSDLLASNAT